MKGDFPMRWHNLSLSEHGLLVFGVIALHELLFIPLEMIEQDAHRRSWYLYHIVDLKSNKLVKREELEIHQSAPKYKFIPKNIPKNIWYLKILKC